MRRLLSSVALLALAVMVLLGTAGPASAHSDLEEASPGPGDDVAVGAESVHLSFGEALSVDDGNQVLLETADGEPVATGSPSVVDDDRGLCAALDPLASGEYVLDWRAMSEDGHLIQSRYSFEVSDTGEPTDAGACDGADLAAPELREDGFSVGTLTIAGVGGVALLLVLRLFVRRVRADRRTTPAQA